MVFGLTIFLLTFLASCSQQPAKPPASTPQVTVVTVKRQTIPATFDYVGVAQSSHMVEIRARVEGYLDEIAYLEGGMVHEGELLFQIDPKPFEAALAQAKGMMEQQQAALWDATQTVDRLQPLYEQKAASKRDLDNATAQVMGYKAAIDAANAQILQAEINLGYTSIRTPISGLTGQAIFRQGALVGPGANSLLTTVSAIDPIWVSFSVSEGDILKYQRKVTEGKLEFPRDMNFEVEVILSDGTTFPSKGKVDFADPTLRQTTGSMTVRAVLPNQDALLRPGQFVRARLSGATWPDAIIIPQASVMQGNKGLFVYVVNNDNQVESRAITAGDWYKDSWIIDSGLNPGDRVVVDGTNKVMPGATVVAEERKGIDS